MYECRHIKADKNNMASMIGLCLCAQFYRIKLSGVCLNKGESNIKILPSSNEAAFLYHPRYSDNDAC